jgi:riboflavin synthase
MFTGLIEGIGKVKSIRRVRDDMAMTIESPDITDCRIGDSISVDGVCVTVADMSAGSFSMDISGETLSRTTLGKLKQGTEVNLERALRLSDRLGGHLVAGHVDGMGKILKKESQQRSWILRIGIDPKLSRYIIEKGSIAVDGISLTINHCEKDFFEVNIIVQTGKKTTLLKKNVGEEVNIETDLVGKYVEKILLNKDATPERKKGSEIDMEMLIRTGFGD